MSTYGIQEALNIIAGTEDLAETAAADAAADAVKDVGGLAGLASAQNTALADAAVARAVVDRDMRSSAILTADDPRLATLLQQPLTPAIEGGAVPLATGTEATGTSPKLASCTHVHPRSTVSHARINNLLAWPCDPALAGFGGSSFRLTIGTIYVTRIWVPKGPVVGAALFVLSPGTAVTSSYCGIYEPVSHSLVAQTAVQSSNFNAAAGRQIPYTNIWQNPVSQYLDLAVLIGAATTSVGIQLLNSQTFTDMSNLGTSGYDLRFATADTSVSSLPPTLGAKTASSYCIWMGVY